MGVHLPNGGAEAPALGTELTGVLHVHVVQSRSPKPPGPALSPAWRRL